MTTRGTETGKKRGRAVPPATPEDPLPPILSHWLDEQGLKPFAFQREAWGQIMAGRSGLLNAPTGAGKTYAILLGLVAAAWREGWATAPTGPESQGPPIPPTGYQILWITPLRALAKDFHQTAIRALGALLPGWQVALRTGDTSQAERAAQRRRLPQMLITTPESLQLILSQKDHLRDLSTVRAIVIDEWHDLLSTKRGTQAELALARLRVAVPAHRPKSASGEMPPLRVWGISATIGNLDEALAVLMGARPSEAGVIVRADVPKRYHFETLLPPADEPIGRFPWAGHMGLHMAAHVLPRVLEARSCLLFCNTRAQAELWYQTLLGLAPEELAGQSALHHGSIDTDIRAWIEQALSEGRLRLVVTTSSLDLGVDFAPVDRVIQVGSPRGVSRMLQRAGRSGHQPGAVSHMVLVPTHALEIVEFEALKAGAQAGDVEPRAPIRAPVDVLCQYLMTLACGPGLDIRTIHDELRATWAYADLDEATLGWAIEFLRYGGTSLSAYDEYRRLVPDDETPGLYRPASKRVAMRHRMSMGTIASAESLRVRYVAGGYLGTVEESFVNQLKPGQVFFFGGRALEFVQVKGLDLIVRKGKGTKGIVPHWAGGRMPLSAGLSERLRRAIGTAGPHGPDDTAAGPLMAVAPLLEVQHRWSRLPGPDELLVETLTDRDGLHLFFYPFEGRQIHEILASLLAYRITREMPATFTMSMNDYGFELLTDVPLDAEEVLSLDLFTVKGLEADLRASINETDQARQRFWQVATIAGLIWQGRPGERVAGRHLRTSSNLVFDVLREYDPDNRLLTQAYDEVFDFSTDQSRLVSTLERINAQRLVLERPPRPTPFAFGLLMDRLRARLSGEPLEARIERLLAGLERAADQA